MSFYLVNSINFNAKLLTDEILVCWSDEYKQGVYSHLSNKSDFTLTDFYWFHCKTFNILAEPNEDFSHSHSGIKNWKKFSSSFCNFITPTHLFQPPRLLEGWEYLHPRKSHVQNGKSNFTPKILTLPKLQAYWHSCSILHRTEN